MYDGGVAIYVATFQTLQQSLLKLKLIFILMKIIFLTLTYAYVTLDGVRMTLSIVQILRNLAR